MDFMHTENVHTLHNVYTKFTEETKLVANMLFGTKTMSWFLIGFCLKHDSYTLADGAEIHHTCGSRAVTQIVTVQKKYIFLETILQFSVE